MEEEGVFKRRAKNYINLPFPIHVAAGAIIRIVLIVYARFHDQMFEVQYTDVDYRVFTDAARYVVDGESPYKRHTYRYSPIIAFLMTPNVYFGDFGKILFVYFDLLIAAACKELVVLQMPPNQRLLSKVPSYCAQLWLYNPMSIAISTRGNADSVPCFLVIISLYFLRTTQMSNIFFKYSLSGILLGMAIHLRLYPIVFSFPMFLSLGAYDSITNTTNVCNGLWLLMPNRRQVILTLSCMFAVIGITYSMYRAYGYEFLFETYLYHLFRKDTRHNFSVMFYYSYLTMDELQIDLVKVVVQIFEILILFMISLKFGVRQDSLPFAMFCQAVVLVAFNTVLTSQYFVWFLSLLPLVAHCFNMPSTQAFYCATAWIFCQSGWLFYAYLLEFRNQELFLYLWLWSVFFFASHIYVLLQMIKSYKIGHGFGLRSHSRVVDKKKE